MDVAAGHRGDGDECVLGRTREEDLPPEDKEPFDKLTPRESGKVNIGQGATTGGNYILGSTAKPTGKGKICGKKALLLTPTPHRHGVPFSWSNAISSLHPCNW
eukprot:Nk52_evm6s1763 gene=Nk52_evmTU6s1763